MIIGKPLIIILLCDDFATNSTTIFRFGYFNEFAFYFANIPSPITLNDVYGGTVTSRRRNKFSIFTITFSTPPGYPVAIIPPIFRSSEKSSQERMLSFNSSSLSIHRCYSE